MESYIFTYKCVRAYVCMYVCTVDRFGPRAHSLYFYRIIFQQTMAYFLFIFCFYPHAYVMQRGWCDWESRQDTDYTVILQRAHTYTQPSSTPPHI